MNIRLLIFAAAVLVLSSCNLFERDKKEGAVVQLGDHYLYESDLAAITSGAATPEDSMQYAKTYIRHWAMDILQYEQGRKLTRPEIEALVDDYRRSLYVQAYEDNAVERHMNKHVTQAERDTFYSHHADRFVLQENILKGALVVVPKDAPKQKDLQKWLGNLTDEDGLVNLENYTYQYATGYELFTDRWVTGSQVMMRMPSNEWQKRLSAGRLYTESDSASTYMLQVVDCRLVGDTMPKDYAKMEIDRMVLSERRVDFLKQQRKELYESALRFGKIQFYK